MKRITILSLILAAAALARPAHAALPCQLDADDQQVLQKLGIDTSSLSDDDGKTVCDSRATIKRAKQIQKVKKTKGVAEEVKLLKGFDLNKISMTVDSYCTPEESGILNEISVDCLSASWRTA